ncbi:MAG: universal stress protein [Promethearchaeota archaeon]
MFKNIIIGVDGSADSYNAATCGITLAKILQAKIVFFFVITTDYIKQMYGDETSIKKSISQVDDILLEQARTKEIADETFKKLEVQASKVLGSDFFQMKIAYGHPIEEFVKELKTGEHDLAIIGRKGASKAQRAVLGSLIDTIIEKTSIPCLIIGSSEKEKCM